MQFQKHAPVRNSSFPAFNDLINGLFDDTVNTDLRRWNSAAINIKEDDSSYILEVAAPGLKKEDFKLNVEKNVLQINASVQKAEEVKTNTHRYTRREFSLSSFSRNFTLPETVNVEGIIATYENGIMYITLPKREDSIPKSRDITIG